MRLRVLSAILLAALATVFMTSPAFAVTSKDVEKELMCQCGCTMVVDVCDCDTANQVRVKIAGFIAQGQSKDQIVAYFVGQYGEKVLSAPTKTGFNLVAWVVPFAAVAVGGIALFFILRAWAGRGRKGVGAEEALVQPVSAEDADEYKDRLEAELKRFKEEGS